MKRPNLHSDIPTEEMEGLPQSGEPLFLVVGKIRRPHGVKGELAMEVITDYPERITPDSTLLAGDEHQPIHLESVRWHQNSLLIKLQGYDTPESAGVFRNVLIYKPIEEIPALPKNEYYHHQLIGLKVEDEQGNELGSLREILLTGANDVFVITTPEDKELLLPVIESVLLNVDLEKQIIRVKPPEWE